MLTVDLQVLGQRHRDIKNGMTVPPRITVANVLDIVTKPAWALSILKGKSKTFGNLAGHVKGMDGIKSLAQWTNEQFDPRLNWKDVEWIRSLWPGKLIIKGILDVDDARRAAKTGASALIVSNHGGRQLDGAPSSISMLPKVVDAVGSDIEVMFDGGIRTGADILRALALGARSLHDRPRLYLRARRQRRGRRRQGDRYPEEGTRCRHGALRREIDRRNRPARAGGLGLAEFRQTGKAAQAPLIHSSFSPYASCVAGSAVIFVRQEFAGHADADAVALGVGSCA